MFSQRQPLRFALLALVAATTVASWDCESRYQDSPNGWGTRMGKAATANDMQCVKYFLTTGDDPNRGNKLSEKAIHYAARVHGAAIIQILLESGSEVDPVNALKHTPLMDASCNGQPNAITVLLNAGADANYINVYGDTASSLACTCPGAGEDCPKDTILTLLDTSGSGIACEDLYKDDPRGFGRRLQYAIRAEDLYCTEFFLEKGDDVNQWDRNGGTPLMDAASTSSAELVQICLKYGAKADSKDARKFTPLMYSSCNGKDNNVDVLIDAGVKTEFEDNNGKTAADLACTCTESTSCLEGKITNKIGETQLYTYFNTDFKSSNGILNDGSKDITLSNRDCYEMCKSIDSCDSWTRIKKETATNKEGECWLRNWKPNGVPCSKCDSGEV